MAKRNGQLAVMNREALVERLSYKVPQMRLALIREKGDGVLERIERPEDAQRFLSPLQYYSEEYFVALHLDVKLQIIGYNVVSHGTLSSSLVHPREVFKAALLANSHALIVAHNHPAGSLGATAEDLQTTKQLIEAGKLLGVELVDHVIVTPTNGMASIRENYPSLWT